MLCMNFHGRSIACVFGRGTDSCSEHVIIPRTENTIKCQSIRPLPYIGCH